MIKNLKKKTKNITTKNKIKSSELKTTTKTTSKNCNKIEKNRQNKNVKLKFFCWLEKFNKNKVCFVILTTTKKISFLINI